MTAGIMNYIMNELKIIISLFVYLPIQYYSLIIYNLDISNGTRPWSIAPRWSMRILEEGHA